MKKVLIILILSGSVFINSVVGEKNSSEKQDIESAIYLFRDFISKIESETPFTFEEGLKYFGPIPTFNLNTSLLIQLGYLSGKGEWLKPKPAYSPLGELIRSRKNLIFPENVMNATYLVGKERYFEKNGSIAEGSFYRMFIQVYREDQSPGNLIGVEYVRKIPSYEPIDTSALKFPITVNGASIMEDLGFSRNSKGNWILAPEEIQELKKLLSDKN